MVFPLRTLLDLIRSRLAARFFLLVAVSVVVPAAILFIAGLSLFEGAVRQSVDAELQSSLDRTERDLTSFLADLVAVSGTVANDEEVRRALTSEKTEFERVRLVDRAVGTVLSSIPGRDSVRYTIIGSSPPRIYSSWSRNFNNYSFLADLPIAKKAAAMSGHLVWEGFSPSFVLEEGRHELFVSIARSIPADPGEPSGVVIFQAERDAFRKYFRERRASSSYTALLFADGGLVVDTASMPVSAAATRKATELVSTRTPGASDSFETRIGGYLAAGRNLTGLPPELVRQGWTLVVLYDYRDLDRRFSRLRALFAPSFVILLLSAIVASYFATNRVVRPIADLSRRMEAFSPDLPAVGADDSPDAKDRRDEIGALERSFLRLKLNVGELIGSLQREHSVKEHYRFRALSAQLNPHFLFNSLNSLRWMAILRKADNIVEAIDQLSGLLAYSMGKEGDHSTLRGELESVESYIAIQNLRYGGRFVLARQVPEELLDTVVLRFMLQPLVENCVVHGYRGVSRDGLIEVSAWTESGTLVVQVADRGQGPESDGAERGQGSRRFVEESGTSESSDPLDGGKRTGNAPGTVAGLGMANVRDMLAITYGAGASVELLPREGGGSVVLIRIPSGAGGGTP